ncbi:MAG: mechanosensitive ion channel family protein [bacterium]|nr:mechanosensitive ion channel family protein [bacterium]
MNLPNINLDTIMHSVAVVIFFRIVFLAIVLKVTNVFLKYLAHRITQKIENKKQAKQITTILATIKSVIDLMIVSIFLMEILPKLGIDIRPFLTAAGVLGVAVGFGSKQFIEDLISGMDIIFQGQLFVGDIVEIDGKVGTVERLNLKMVALRDWDGKVHYIRNGMINIITNYTRDFAYVIAEVSVAYKENVDRVIQVVSDVVNNELKKGEHASYIIGNMEVWGLDSFEDSALKMKFRIKTKSSYQWKIKREFNRLVKNKFDELGIEIPFPQRTLHVAKDDVQRILENK